MLDVRQAEILVATAAEAIPDIERQIEQTENVISVLLGRPPRPMPRGRPLGEQITAAAVPAGLPSTLLERRPDVRQVEEQLAAATARIGVAKSDYFPRVFLTGAVGAGGLMVDGRMFGPQGIFARPPVVHGPDLQLGPRLGRGQVGRGAGPGRRRSSISRRCSGPSATCPTRSSNSASAASSGSSRSRWPSRPATRRGCPTSATRAVSPLPGGPRHRAPALRRRAEAGPRTSATSCSPSSGSTRRSAADGRNEQRGSAA